jgi:hypothetical protein
MASLAGLCADRRLDRLGDGRTGQSDGTAVSPAATARRSSATRRGSNRKRGVARPRSAPPRAAPRAQAHACENPNRRATSLASIHSSAVGGRSPSSSPKQRDDMSGDRLGDPSVDPTR